MGDLGAVFSSNSHDGIVVRDKLGMTTKVKGFLPLISNFK